MGNWKATERQVIDGFFRFSPTHARYVGDHRFDGVVGDFSRTAIDTRVTEIDRDLSTIAAPQGLDKDQAIDRRERRPGYTLKAFQDAFLGSGAIPIPLIRELIT